MLKKHDGSAYIFAVAMRGDKTTATFTLRGLEGRKAVEVLGENRVVASQDGVFTDSFGPWDVHIYRIRRGAKGIMP